MIVEKTPTDRIKELQSQIITEMVLYVVDHKIKIVFNRIENAKQVEFDALPKDCWVHIAFKVEDQEKLNDLLDFEKYLRDHYGVRWDTGFGNGWRDWDLDWSFEEIKE